MMQVLVITMGMLAMIFAPRDFLWLKGLAIITD